MLDGDRLVVFDWQNACHGNCAFDLAGALTSVKPELVAQHGERLLSRYYARVAAPGYALAA